MNINGKIGFNVYKPRANFKKSQPPEPDFRVIAYSIHDPLPDTYDYLFFKAQGNVRIAIVDGSNLSFIQIQPEIIKL